MNLYLVTGGLGFIGSTLVRKLLADESSVVFVVDDMSNNSLEPDHFGVATRNLYAALSDVYNWYEDICRAPAGALQISCSKNPESPYGLSKYCAEQYMHLFEKLYGLEWVALRYFNVYGPVQRGDSPYSTAVAAWCHRSREGQALRSDGDGEQSRDLVHVEDVADVNMLCSSKWDPSLSRAYNVGTGTAVTNNWILERFADRGYVEVNHAPERPGDVKDTLASVQALKDELGWSPKISIEEGIRSTMDWWEL